MNADELPFAAFGAAGVVIGVSLIVFAKYFTKVESKGAASAAKKYAHRPAVLRPQIANARPSLSKTRSTGVGFMLIGLCLLVAALTGNVRT